MEYVAAPACLPAICPHNANHSRHTLLASTRCPMRLGRGLGVRLLLWRFLGDELEGEGVQRMCVLEPQTRSSVPALVWEGRGQGAVVAAGYGRWQLQSALLILVAPV